MGHIMKKVRWLALEVLGALTAWLVYKTREPTLTVPGAPWGIVSLQLAGDEQEARAVLDAWDRANVRVAAERCLYWDNFFPAAYAPTLALALVLAAGAVRGRWPFPARLGIVLACAQGLAMLCNYVQNYALWKMLDGAFGPFPRLAQVCATCKFAILFAGILYLLALGIGCAAGAGARAPGGTGEREPAAGNSTA
jgi:hypothetical protein